MAHGGRETPLAFNERTYPSYHPLNRVRQQSGFVPAEAMSLDPFPIRFPDAFGFDLPDDLGQTHHRFHAELSDQKSYHHRAQPD